MPRIKQTVVSPEQLVELAKRSDIKGLQRLLAHFALALASGGLVTLAMDFGWLLLPALWFHGVILVFLFAPLHETIHITAFRSRWLNTFVANVLGFVLVLPPKYFRAFHLEHHRFTQHLEKDPELFKEKPQSWRSFLLHISGVPYWRERLSTTFRYAIGAEVATFVPKSERQKLYFEARFYVATYALLLFSSISAHNAWLFWYWLIPVLLAQPVLRLYLLAEHTGCEFVPDMFKNSRTTLTNSFVRFLAWNMPYHCEHHAFAVVPFHSLPALHEKVKDKVMVKSPGYFSVVKGIVARF